MFLIFISLFSLLSISANELGQVNVSHSFSNTSDGLKTKTNTMTYATNRRDIFWKYEDAKEEASDLIFGVVQNDSEYLGDIVGIKLFSGYGKKWNANNYSILKFGFHKLDYKSTESTTAYIEFNERLVIDKNTLELNINYDFLYINGGVPGPYSDKLKRLQTKLSGVYTPKNFIRIPYELEYTKISASNSLQQQSVSVLGGASYPVWFWLGYRLARLSYDRTDIGYWSPEKFISHGPQIEWSQVFFSNLTFKMSYLYSFIKENDGETGNSYYASSSIEYGSRNSLLVGLSIYRNESIQNSNEWWSEGGELYLKYSF